jgi:hypothetical protein
VPAKTELSSRAGAVSICLKPDLTKPTSEAPVSLRVVVHTLPPVKCSQMWFMAFSRRWINLSER